MALVPEILRQSIYTGLYEIFIAQSNKASSGSESENPEDVIKKIANDMDTVITTAVDAYIKSGDILISSKNIVVTSPAGGCAVAPATPAKIQ